MAGADTAYAAPRAAEQFCGPDDFAEVLLAARHEAQGDEALFGNLSADGLRRLIHLAYYASQAPNEGRFPRLRLLVPARGEEVQPFVPLHDELTVAGLHRLGPALASQDHALVVHEHGLSLRAFGIAALRGLLTEMSLGDPAARPLARPKGLSVEVAGPGHLRAGEHRMHRLQAGALHQEVSFVFEGWFREWYEEAANDLFGWPPEDSPVDSSWPQLPGFPVVNVWLRLLRKAADLRQGGCFVVVPEPAQAPVRHSFLTAGCDLGRALASCFEAVRASRLAGPATLTPEEFRSRVLRREQLLSAIDAVAHLSASDGCVVFNRRLQLLSFGSMIKVPERHSAAVPCLLGNSSTPLDDETLRSFGARRRSALYLCRACPQALAFVISQDGDLRLFVNRQGAVRFYDHTAY
jgi:hypothetical protein